MKIKAHGVLIESRVISLRLDPEKATFWRRGRVLVYFVVDEEHILERCESISAF